ncbi:predicted protein [Postia placenta Mad-698-R]|nr:predicted protein [Postia placenta Mad-698-R]
MAARNGSMLVSCVEERLVPHEACAHSLACAPVSLACADGPDWSSPALEHRQRARCSADATGARDVVQHTHSVRFDTAVRAQAHVTVDDPEDSSTLPETGWTLHHESGGRMAMKTGLAARARTCGCKCFDDGVPACAMCWASGLHNTHPAVGSAKNARTSRGTVGGGGLSCAACGRPAMMGDARANAQWQCASLRARSASVLAVCILGGQSDSDVALQCLGLDA